ncbi:hypothetical protein M758_4G009200 [Ceratodon purpureus]|nr:hypothetical protein M758_4G009200 [Ceratodon purpureus]
MAFLSLQSLGASVRIALLVGLCGLIDNGIEFNRKCSLSDQKYSNNGDVRAFSGRLCDWDTARLFQVLFCNSCDRKSVVKPALDKIYVDQAGHGDTRTVQEAVELVMDGNKKRVTIYISAGTYTEKVLVPNNKPYITFQGSGSDKTVITWNDNANKTGSTYKTASVAIEADHFIAWNISFKNTAPTPGPGIIGAQAIALQVVGDKCAFYGCAVYGYQDTLNDHQGRHYFKECYIEGIVDFIFGNARSLYESCIIRSNLDKWGAITAHSRLSEDEVTGFGFVHCSLIGTGQIFLGRAWRSYARVVFASTYMEEIINSQGWDDWGNKSADETVFYGEYNNNGPGASLAGRVSYTRALSSMEAAKYTHIDWINGSDWLHG